MKVKLLKKLRKRYELHERNGKYKVFNNVVCFGGRYNQTNWVDREEAIRIRRELILENSVNYSVAKHKN